ncbi:RUN domain-containing protein [Aphelenchoides besseyi]|nr:RUN domain-containing protein [Aphelenchoides besseyi]KAI6225724.1 RUN domain-containing protein [Aphelenchoides besseyi]
MVDLCDLKLIANMANGATLPDVAELDFENSTDDQSLFSSIAGMDVALISTDSLDMDQLRQRCETNKNDYKLTFEDSGQWTTSGFGTGTSPSGAATHYEDSADEERRHGQSTDYLLNNDEVPNGTLTTWGRIRSVEPFDARTNSLPASNVSFRTPTANSRRPTSLLANFVERQNLTGSPPPEDYEYHEEYRGNGRYVDLNENEIGFVPANTASIQRNTTAPIATSTPRDALPPVPTSTHDRWRDAHRPTASKPPRRTFAELQSPTPAAHAPDLNFLALPFKVPNFCRTSPSLDEILRHTQRSDRPNGRLSASKTEALLSDCLAGETSDAAARLFSTPTPSSTTLTDGPDSGLGSSSTAGPSHIEDWGSLSILLPKNVVDACSFFKSNVTLLSGSAANSIERQNRTVCSEPHGHRSFNCAACRTCFGVRNGLHPPSSFAHSQRSQLCDCTDLDETRRFASFTADEKPRRSTNRRARLHAEELSVIGHPIYDAKRRIVESVVEGVAEIARGGSAVGLCNSLERLLADGMLEGKRVWSFIVEVTRPGRATFAVHELVERLQVDEKPENSRVQSFFAELLRTHSLDGWLSYVVLKERVLASTYSDTAFIVRAHTAYRSLFWRLIESLELLSVLTKCERPTSTDEQGHSNCAARLASDSRVPKSSSVPTSLNTNLRTPTEQPRRLLNSTTAGSLRRRRRGSKIPVSSTPVSSHRRSRSTQLTKSEPTNSIGRSHSNVVRVRESILAEGLLPLAAGEEVRIIQLRGSFARCCRVKQRKGVVLNGTVPTHFLEM